MSEIPPDVLKKLKTIVEVLRPVAWPFVAVLGVVLGGLTLHVMSRMPPEVLKGIAEVLKAVAWPLVAFVAGLTFQKEVRSLLGRLRKGGSLEFYPIPQIGDVTAVALLKTSTSHGWEEEIRQFPVVMQAMQASDPVQRENALVNLAATLLREYRFELIESGIWCSQLSLLHDLFTKSAGESLVILRQDFYAPAAKEFPDMFGMQPSGVARYSFDGYMEFLMRGVLVERTGVSDSVRLTERGVEYLAWRRERGKAPKTHG